MKSYVFILDDAVHANPGSAVPAIQKELAAKGSSNFNFLSEVGLITADFPDDVTFEPIVGVQSIEEQVVFYHQDGVTIVDQVTVHTECSIPTNVSSVWSPEQMVEAKPLEQKV